MSEMFGTIIHPSEKKEPEPIRVPEELGNLVVDNRQKRLLFGPLEQVPMSKSLARALSGYPTLYEAWLGTSYWQDNKKKWAIKQASHGGALEELEILFDKAGLLPGKMDKMAG